MKNFAEEIAYWYFRLNGFFLLENYVSHKSETDSSSYADNDLIGIRPKNVTEIIGLLNPADTCHELKKIIPDIGTKTIGIICEVKGGNTKTTTLNPTKLKSCINRLGLLETGDIRNAYKELTFSSKFEGDNFSIHKIFTPISNSAIPHWDKIAINTMIDFLKSRINIYGDKGKAWNHYNSSLFQYLLYEVRNKNV